MDVIVEQPETYTIPVDQTRDLVTQFAHLGELVDGYLLTVDGNADSVVASLSADKSTLTPNEIGSFLLKL